jgi:hypothetical protein
MSAGPTYFKELKMEKKRTRIDDLHAIISRTLNMLGQLFTPEMKLVFIAFIPEKIDASILVASEGTELGDITQVLEKFQTSPKTEMRMHNVEAGH